MSSSAGVLYLIDSVVPGGAERSLAAFAPYVKAAGIDLSIGYLHDRPGLQDRLRSAGIELFCLAGGGGRAGWIRRAGALIREVRPQLVHTTLFEADIAGRIAASMTGVPVASSLVNLEYGPEQFQTPGVPSWRLRGAWALDRWTAKRVVRWHAITRHVADVMAGRLRIPRQKIDVITRGREPRELGRRDSERRHQMRASFGVAADEPVVLVLARQEHQKGLDVLLDAWSRVTSERPGARLWLAGRAGDATEGLRDQASRLGPNARVEFLGPRDDVPALLCAADVFALPSRWEGLGSVLLEAMALETPIVASAIPAVEEILEHERSALLVGPERPADLAHALLRTLRDTAAARVRAAAGRRDFDAHYTIDVTAEQMVRFYERTLALTRVRTAA